MKLTDLSISNALSMLKNREISAVELANAYIDVCQEKNTKLNAFITLSFEKAIESAKHSDFLIGKNSMRNLEGIPLGIKDIFCTKGVLTTCGSKMLSNFIPEYESTVTNKLIDNGAIFVGKTNMDEFAMGSTTKNSFYGPSINSYRNMTDATKDLICGGSSGGSAVSVAADMCMASLGTDTGGSIRQPASLCGVFGIKPTYGRCSRWGIIAFASSLDQAGVFAKNTRDGALILDTICGYDSKDSTSAKGVKNINFSSMNESEQKNIKDLKCGVLSDKFFENEIFNSKMDTSILKKYKEAQKELVENGIQIVELDFDNLHYAISVYYIIAPAEASSNLSRYDGIRYGFRPERNYSSISDMISSIRGEGFGEEVKRRLMIGSYVLSSDSYEAFYIKAQKIRRLIFNEFQNAFQKVDFILKPVTTCVAYELDYEEDPISVYLNDIFTIPSSLAGLPCLSVPFGFDDVTNLPIGIQIIGRHYDEDTILKVSSVLEKNYK